jgi:hypothetical protein
MNGSHATGLAVLASLVIASQTIAAEGNPVRGQHIRPLREQVAN